MPPATNPQASPTDYLKPYLFHGIELVPSGDESVGTCPWCGRENKFSVNPATGQWRCLVCNEGKETEKAIKGGNIVSFIQFLWKRSYQQTPTKAYDELAAERKLLRGDTLKNYAQLAKSIITGNWLMPGYTSDGRMTGLYQWLHTGGRMAWLPTPTTGHRLLGMSRYNPQCNRITLLEGIWDSATYWEVLQMAKENGEPGRLVRTASAEASLGATESVLGLASCQAFNEQWVHLFQGKEVWLLGQNDHEKQMCAGCRKSYSKFQYKECPSCGSTEVTGNIIAPASYGGMERIARLVCPVADSIGIYNWGERGFDPTLPSGYDQRDLLNV